MRLRKQFLIILSMACLLLLSSCSVMDQVQNIFVSNSEALEYNDKGFKLMEEERHEEALEYFFKGVTSLEEGGGNKKTMGTLYNNISWAYTSLGEYEESLEYIDKAIEITPNDAIVVSNRANALYGLGRYDEAIESFNKALEIDKHLDVAHYGKGVYHYDHDEYELALEAFTTYLSYEKNDEDAITYKVYSFLYLDKIDEALSFIEEHIAKDKENYFAYDLKANVLDWESKYDELKALYQELMALFPDTLDPKIHAGRIDYIQGHYEEAAAHFVKVIEESPQHIELYLWAIDVFSELGQLDRALNYYTKGLEIDGTSFDLHSAIGNAHVDQSLYLESIPFFDKAIALDKEYIGAYYDKIYALYEGKNYEECIVLGKEYGHLFDYSTSFPWYVADSYLQLGNYQEAITYYNKTLEINPELDDVYADIAFTYLELKDIANAKVNYQKSLELYPENDKALYVKSEIEK